MNLKDKTCTVAKITHPFRRVGVPPDARFLFEGEYGAAGIPAEHFIAATFGGKFEDGGKQETALSLFQSYSLTRITILC